MFGNLFSQRQYTSNQPRFDQDQQGLAQPPPAPPPPLQQPPPPPPRYSVNQQLREQQMAQQPSQPQAESQEIVSSTMDPSKRQNVSALSRLDTRATQVLQHATNEAKRVRQALIEPEQILFGLLYDSEIFKLLEQFQVDVAALSREIQSKEKMGEFVGQPNLSKQSQEIFEQAYVMARDRNSSFIAPEDILIALFNSESASYLTNVGVEKKDLEERLLKVGGYSASGKRSVLEKYGIDLTEQAKEGILDPVVSRDKEIERLVHILLRRTKNNPVIIGEAGVGKTAIVEGLAQKIVKGEVPSDLAKRKIIQLDLTSLVAGASHRGEFEERLRGVIREVQALSHEVILFVDEIHTLIGTGDTEGALDASNIIKPYLARGQLQIIGTTTTSEYRKHVERDKAFERRFQPIMCDEPSEEVAIQMLEILKPKYENFHKVTFSAESLESAVKLSKKYIGERFLPDKAVDLLDEAAADVKLQHEGGSRENNSVEKADIEKVVSAWTGIPITKLTEDESEKLLNLEKRIHQRLINQEEAVIAVSEAVRRGRIGLAAANRPIASFIFLGPTGVGKTELAKTLAEILFGRDDSMVRLDMSEYMEKHEVAKLIGAPPGYVGYEEGGQLTEAVRAKPYSIVLLDEIEKAHPDVFNILLQLLEDGRLTDNKGNTISFKNTIVIATSNIGSPIIQKELSEQDPTTPDFAKKFSELTKILMDELHKFFKPELLNRFDELVVFKPLNPIHMTSIAKLNIEKTRKLLVDQGFNLTISDQALAVLAKEGYDPVYGARPLRRLIQSAIENPIALLIIGKTFVSGDTIVVDYDQAKQEFTFTKGAPITSAPESNAAGGETSQPQGVEQVGSEQAPQTPTEVPQEQNLQTPIPPPPPIPPIPPQVEPTQPIPPSPDGEQQGIIGQNEYSPPPSTDGTPQYGSQRTAMQQGTTQ